MALAALLAGWCLAGPVGDDRAREPALFAKADTPGLHPADSAPSRCRPYASTIHRQKTRPIAATASDIDEDAEEDSPSLALYPVCRLENGPNWSRVVVRPGAGQVRHVSTERIPLRC